MGLTFNVFIGDSGDSGLRRLFAELGGAAPGRDHDLGRRLRAGVLHHRQAVLQLRQEGLAVHTGGLL